MTVFRRLLSVAVAVLLVGCGGSEGSSDAPDDPEGDAAGAPTLQTVSHADAMDAIKTSDAKLTVVNFWATWCVPCVEEFPGFVKLDRRLDDRGVDVMFISTDFPDKKQKVVDFLAEHDVTGTSYLREEGNTTSFVNSFSEEWSGAVPATFVYDAAGTRLDFWEGKVDYDSLRARVVDHLDDA